MEYTTFKNSLREAQPPGNITVHLEALWNAEKGNWQQAHTLVEDLPDQVAAHIHAYLHRIEGDQWNAEYWYKRAGERLPLYSLEKEWEFLVKACL
jgi:hypothetical protein